MATTRERRLNARQTVTRPCTLFRRRTQRFVAAQTVDISAGGALVEVQSPRPLVEGETIDVGVAWTASPVISQRTLIEAKVVRIVDAHPESGRQTVAVRFDHADVLAAVA
jgi:c-di-GMP-binding flagellar brake protein YcgR